jgi:hypothetical protein
MPHTGRCQAHMCSIINSATITGRLAGLYGIAEQEADDYYFPCNIVFFIDSRCLK